MSDNRRKATVAAVRQIQRAAGIEVVDETAQGQVSIRATPVIVRETNYAETAGRLANAVRISLAGEAIGDALFDGAEPVTIETTVSSLSNTQIEELLH